jgi:hypothetical protein
MEWSPQYLIEFMRVTTRLRTSMLDQLTDADLAARIPGNPTLGELCRELGHVERCYLEAFRTRQLTWDLPRDESPESATRVAALRAWYQALDAEFEAVLGAIPVSDFQSLTVARGSRVVPAATFYQNYHEALLMFCARCGVYLRMLGKPFSQQWLEWIG